MCYSTQLKSDVKTIEKRFSAKFKNSTDYIPKDKISGFEFPINPVITNEEPKLIQFYYWGFLPSWVNDLNFRANTLNAKYETLNEKPSFKPYLNQRCIVLADAFYEWKWLDTKGKNKQGYRISLTSEAPFAFAGLYNRWKNSKTGEWLSTYTILTTAANKLMEEIHNSKKRMPIILNKGSEENYLKYGSVDNEKIQLNATPIESSKAIKSNQIKLDF